MELAPADPSLLSAHSLQRAYRRKELSPVDVVDAVFKRLHDHNDAVNAFSHVDPAAARAQALESEARWRQGMPLGPIDGIPITIKESLDTRGWPQRKGSLTVPAEQRAEGDCPVVQHMRRAGAVFVGQTTMPEFGWKGVTHGPAWGITRNPWDTRMTPGGSSGGAAVAAALNLGCLHFGTDAAGSVRIPAAFTGVFGHKPTFGRAPAWPLSMFGTLSHIGPMSRTVMESALMLSVMAQRDRRDRHQVPSDPPDYTVGLEDGVAGLRIGLSLAPFGYSRVDPEVADAIAASAKAFEDMGAIVEPAEPAFPDAVPLIETLWFNGAAAALSHVAEVGRCSVDPGLLRDVIAGEKQSPVAVTLAEAQRAAWHKAAEDFHQTYDLWLTPVMPIAAFEAGHDFPPDGGFSRHWTDWSPFTYPINLSQQPACSCPAGLTSAGLPIGLHIVGRLHDDALVLRAARAFESARPFLTIDTPNVQHQG